MQKKSPNLTEKKNKISQADLRFAAISMKLTRNTERLELTDIRQALNPATRALDTDSSAFSFLDAEIKANQRQNVNVPVVAGGTPELQNIVKQAITRIREQRGFEAFNNTIHIQDLPEGVGGRFYPSDTTSDGFPAKAGDISIDSVFLSEALKNFGPEAALQVAELIGIHEIQHHYEWLAYNEDPRYKSLASSYTIYDEVPPNRMENNWLSNETALGRPLYWLPSPDSEEGIRSESPALYESLPPSTERESILHDEVYRSSIGRLNTSFYQAA